ncbi:MAG TPA: hypothetical protein VNY29_02195 [Terriglobales bacterium]|jgi:hypothetical protein|nr:hypothetical protein [Terriglobales bacterium]
MVQARPTAGWQTILIPRAGGQIEKYLVVRQQMRTVMAAQRSIHQPPIAVAHRSSPEPHELLEAITIRDCTTPDRATFGDSTTG